MNTKLSIAAFSLLLVITSSLQVQGQWNSGMPDFPRPGLRSQLDLEAMDGSYVHPTWGSEFRPVPNILRMHCPILKPEQGLLIGRIHRGGLAAQRYNLQVGDVLLAVGEMEVVGLDSLPDSPGAELTVMRGGKVIPLVARESDSLRQTPTPRRMPWLPNVSRGTSRGVSATAVAGGNESVSVAQNGDQITLEMSLPNLESQPIRFQGTRDQIIRDVKASSLTPAAQQKVLEAIR